MLRQKSRSYSEMGVPDLFAKDDYRDFVTRLTEKHAQNGFGDEAYKAPWCDETIALHDYIQGVNVRGDLVVGREKLFRQAKKAIKDSPGLFSFLQRLRSSI